jgi:hypothetical protein
MAAAQAPLWRLLLEEQADEEHGHAYHEHNAQKTHQTVVGKKQIMEKFHLDSFAPCEASASHTAMRRIGGA